MAEFVAVFLLWHLNADCLVVLLFAFGVDIEKLLLQVSHELRIILFVVLTYLL
jgi:hypothetical protein